MYRSFMVFVIIETEADRAVETAAVRGQGIGSKPGDCLVCVVTWSLSSLCGDMVGV